MNNKKTLYEDSRVPPPPPPGQRQAPLPPAEQRQAPPPPASQRVSRRRVYKKCEGPDLYIGCKGENVAELQRKIIKAGFSVGDKGPDGIFGNDTQNGLKNYQNKIGVTPSGVYDQQTIDKEEKGATTAPTPAPAPVTPTPAPAPSPAPVTPPTAPPTASTSEKPAEPENKKEEYKQEGYNYIDNFRTKLGRKEREQLPKLGDITFGGNKDMKDLVDYLVDNKKYTGRQVVSFFDSIFGDKVIFEEESDKYDFERTTMTFTKYYIVFSRGLGTYLIQTKGIEQFRAQELQKIYNTVTKIIKSADRKTILDDFRKLILSKIKTFSPELASTLPESNSTLPESKLQQNYYLEPVKSRFNQVEKLVFERLVKGCK